MARLQGQRGGGGPIIALLVLLVLALLYFIVLAPLLNLPLPWDVLNLNPNV